MIGSAVGGSFVTERGRRVLPAVIGATLVFAAVLGWALNFVMYAFYASAFHESAALRAARKAQLKRSEAAPLLRHAADRANS